MKCGKDGCACGSDRDARHGPYYSITRAIGGETQSRLLNPAQAEVARRQIEAAHQFRDDLEEYWQVCEKLADEELDGAIAQTAGAVKKKGSKRPLNRQSAMRSSA